LHERHVEIHLLVFRLPSSEYHHQLSAAATDLRVPFPVKIRADSSGSPDREQVKRLLLRIELQHLAQSGIVERSNGHTSQTQRRGLEADILGCVASLHENVADAALSILDCSSPINCRDQNHGPGMLNEVLIESGTRDGAAQPAWDNQ
jgi:hypothetical protein